MYLSLSLSLLDRSHVFWDPDIPYIPAEHRHPRQPGDFELNSFSVSDLLVTVIQPGGFRPFKVSIISAHAPRLRKQWLFYDLLCADSVLGVFDECLFSMHRAQRPATLSETSLTDSFSNDEQQQQQQQRMVSV
jgi:distribution and morphology protein 31